MPKFTYLCNCGVEFQKWMTADKQSIPQSCPSCKSKANVKPPSDFGGAVYNKEVSGPIPQNTGLHDLDTHIDRVIGQSAKQGWGVIEQRYRDKVAMLKDNGIDGDSIKRNPDGSYGVLKPEEKEMYKGFNKMAIGVLKRQK